ncbi:MAG TPA: AAA family ATPase [Anaeromyxobacteraceae bacterium]|jgi:type II secretory pathway predicted ATPase ExeA|nr:AAA family ATPase [Anaeromyxobacteraceae bacterium]
MYLEHYGLRAKPFSKSPDPAFLFPSRQHAEALARLSHALEEREPAVLTGEVGAGKTTLSRALVDAFADRCRFALVVNPALPAAQLLAAVSDAFGLPRQKRKGDVYAALAEFAAALDAEDQFPVVVVDEAQLLPGRGAYDELRLLTNLTADDRALVGLVLIGQPELRDRIRGKGGEAFSQRIGVAYHLGALEVAEVASYLSHRLRVAGRLEPLFTEDAVVELHARSGGVPRRINQLAASALLEGFARELHRLDADVVTAAAADLDAYLGGRPARG